MTVLFTLLFLFTFLTTVNWAGSVLVMIFSAVENPNFPIPILHKYGVTAGNCYLSWPCISYQAFFWCNPYGVSYVI